MIIPFPEDALRELLNERAHLKAQVTSLQSRCTELLLENRELRARAAEWDRWLRKLPCGHTAHVLSNHGACPVCEIAEADTREVEKLEEECKRLRAELEKAKVENNRLRASLASLGWRPVECGVDGYRCGLCVACGGYEAEPPPIVVEVAR